MAWIYLLIGSDYEAPPSLSYQAEKKIKIARGQPPSLHRELVFLDKATAQNVVYAAIFLLSVRRPLTTENETGLRVKT